MTERKKLLLLLGMIVLIIGTRVSVPAAESALDRVFAAAVPSAGAPELLGPIDESGRVGWICRPEIQARAISRAHSALPDVDR